LSRCKNYEIGWHGSIWARVSRRWDLVSHVKLASRDRNVALRAWICWTIGFGNRETSCATPLEDELRTVLPMGADASRPARRTWAVTDTVGDDRRLLLGRSVSIPGMKGGNCR
jgi:hypothetical protein